MPGRDGVMLALVAAIAVNCGRSPEPIDGIARLIERDPEQTFDARMLRTAAGAFQHRFADRSERAHWTVEVEGVDLAPLTDGMRVVWRFERADLSRPVELDAADVVAIELRVRDTRPLELTLDWQTDGQSELSCGVAAGPPRAVGARERRYRFAVGEHDCWRGQIDRLRVSVRRPGRGRRQVEMIALSGVTVPIADEELATLAEVPFKVALGADLRNARLGLPGRPLRFRVVPPSGAILSLALGVPAGVGVAVHFSIDAIVGRAAPVRLLDETVVPSVEAPRWHDRTVALDAFTGQEVELVLAVDGPAAAGDGLPLWAHPEVHDGAEADLPDVILISIDTLRSDRMSLYGNPRSTSPGIDAWARRSGVVFERAVAAAPWTLPSHTSLLTGLDAARHGANRVEPLASDLPLLAQQLRAAGYVTTAMTGGGYVHPRWGFARGFDRYVYADGSIGRRRELMTTAQLLDSWLETERRRPFFLFLHTYEVHAPYHPREPWFGRFSDHDPQERIVIESRPLTAADGYRERHVLAHRKAGEAKQPLSAALAGLPHDMYDTGIAYTDEILAPFIERLATSSRPTVLILTSDHGEMLGEHGLADHVCLYDEVLAVPLVIQAPGVAGGARISSQVRGVDVTPTILDLVGLEPVMPLDGRSLVPLLHGQVEGGRAAWSYAPRGNFGVALTTAEGLRFIHAASPWGPAEVPDELYDRTVDPDEAHDLAPATDLRDLVARAQAHLDSALRGLRLELSNPGPGRLQGRIDGLIRSPTVLRATDGGCRCFAWRGPDTLEFDLGPGERVRVVAESGPGRPELTVTLAVSGDGDAPAFSRPVAARSIDHGYRIVFDGGEWRAGSGAADVTRPGLAMWWPDGVAPDPSTGTELDPDLAARLQALGYLQD